MRLDETVIAGIHADSRANYQAVIVAFVSALALAVHVPGPGGFLLAVLVPIRFIVWWLLGAFIIYLISTTLLRTKDTPPIDFAPLARGVGFAMGPRVLQIFLFIEPLGIGRLIQYLSIVWMFAAIVASTRLALGQPSYRRVTLAIGLAMLPLILLEPFILGQQ